MEVHIKGDSNPEPRTFGPGAFIGDLDALLYGEKLSTRVTVSEPGGIFVILKSDLILMLRR